MTTPPLSTSAPLAGSGEEFWLFGYGSLIWKPPPHYDLRVPGFITGYVRRFWQASEDHRGTPLSPGRVVTLIPLSHHSTLLDPHPPTSRVWGVAYRIPASHAVAVMSYLDIREINGYTVDYVNFTPSADSSSLSAVLAASNPVAAATAEPIRALLYIGTTDNPQFVGPQDPDLLAAHIARSVGPSGRNAEYLLELERALQKLGGEVDEHVRDLAARVRRLEGVEVVAGGMRGVGAHEEEEEVERVGDVDG